MDHFLSRDADDLLAWDIVSDAVQIEPWAEAIVADILKEPTGEWFMCVAAGLEYMHHKPLGHAIPQAAADEEDDHDADASDAALDEEEKEARAREEAGNAWMVEQGFDSKE
jgi:hypothetical protein